MRTAHILVLLTPRLHYLEFYAIANALCGYRDYLVTDIMNMDVDLRQPEVWGRLGQSPDRMCVPRWTRF